MALPLMPMATAVWLIENTSLTFDQIALFCGLHPLEARGIADGDVAHGIKGMDPINSGQLTRDEIARCQDDPTAQLQLTERKHVLPEPKGKKSAKYTPVSKRQERPDAIAWLVRNHPELNDAQIGRLVGTTKPTIQTVRDRSHWNISNITPIDPVSLGLCTQTELDENVMQATQREERKRKRTKKAEAKMATEETTETAPEINDATSTDDVRPEDVFKS